MSYEIKQIEIGRIYLANENPRHDPIDTEPEIIRHLIVREGVKPLARHIANAGHTSPLERIAVIKHPKVKNAFIAVEGNRRVCALKLLADPDKADTDANKKYFRTLSQSMDSPPTKLEAVVFQSMQEARPWMSLRHEGEQGGIGTKAWNAKQKARFNSQGNNAQNPNIQASLLIDYAQKHHLLSSSQLESIGITTVTRYLSNPVFRNTLGLDDSKTLMISTSIEEFNHVVTRFLSDILNPDAGVNSRTDAKAREKYANKLKAEGAAPTNRNVGPTDAASIQPSKNKNPSSSTKSPTHRDNRSPDDRRHIIPSQFTARISDKILKRLYDELKNIDAKVFPFAGTYLLRAFLEQMATAFLRKKGKKHDDTELHAKLGRMAELLATEYGMTDHQLQFLRTMSTDKTSRYSPATLGNFVHGGAIPTHTHSIKMWDSLENIIETILNDLQ